MHTDGKKRERKKIEREIYLFYEVFTNTCLLSLHLEEQQSFAQLCEISHSIFTTHFNMHCAFSHSSFHPSLPRSLALGSEYEILSFSFIRCSQTQPPCQSWLSDSTYNFLPAICPLKRKIALDRTSPSKTTTINSYNCNGIGAVSPGLGRAFSHTEKRCFKPTLPCNIHTCAESSAPPILS